MAHNSPFAEIPLPKSGHTVLPDEGKSFNVPPDKRTPPTGGNPCTHVWRFLRTEHHYDPQEEQAFNNSAHAGVLKPRSSTDVFFCEKCLKYEDRPSG